MSTRKSVRIPPVKARGPSLLELEFVCHNPAFPGGPSQAQQNAAYWDLLAEPGMLPYAQNFSEQGNPQRSLAVLIWRSADERELFARAVSIGARHGLRPDLAERVDERRLRDVTDGTLPFLDSPRQRRRQANPTPSGEPIVVTAHFVEGGSERKVFKTLAGAQKYAQGRIGAHPDQGGSYAVDNYGSCKITVTGTSLRSLFPTHEEIAAAAPKQKWPCHSCETPTDKGYMVEDGEWESDGWGGSKLIRQDYWQAECPRCTKAEKAKHAKWVAEQKKRQDAINRADRQAAAGRPPKGWMPF